MTSALTRLLAVAGIAALCAAATGCSALTPGAEPVRSDTAGKPVSTVVPEDDITLKIAFSSAPDMVEALAAGFSEKYPNVTIEPQYTQFSDYVKSIKLSMSSDTAPDLAQFAVPSKDLVAAGMLLELDGYAKAYDWGDAFPPSALAQLEMSDNGRTFGTGSLYGAPAAMSLTGVFYNKAMAKELGVTAPPKTLTEFEDALASAKKAGETPIMVGALDYGANHVWGALVNVLTPTDGYRDWVNGVEGGSIVDDASVRATETFANWAKKGYLNASANGIGAADATAQFAKGDGLFLITGNWATAQLATEMGEDVGFFLLPGEDADRPAITSGSSVAYTVSAKTKHPEAAAAFLNWLSTKEAGEIIVEGGFMPADVSALEGIDGLAAEVSEAYTTVIAADGVSMFSDWASPDMLDSLTPGIQGLVAGTERPADFLARLQETRDAYHAD